MFSCLQAQMRTSVLRADVFNPQRHGLYTGSLPNLPVTKITTGSG
jgi:hypothetical protein